MLPLGEEEECGSCPIAARLGVGFPTMGTHAGEGAKDHLRGNEGGNH